MIAQVPKLLRNHMYGEWAARLLEADVVTHWHGLGQVSEHPHAEWPRDTGDEGLSEGARAN
eukprot:CAMPEP_0181210866 /NCGR_PEP_ID=MMETSP1096-20121128/23472_1 /TAXON_ID=156174 ORGANISM="Chrysochromulina ericina, Strain CCMP281" /NCGR_SAMPLE_ID=MMETSP1096 /ASSEMBLY_ACC=CAM_ASM_000453 /LENGTH=60 /DNA_ID=CAMNT_0023302211 /DNA_START=393 /DNA_END=575 /DNA_ORIENTATION=+